MPEGMDRADLPGARADAMILLWLPGGIAQHDFWDAKGYTPFEPGMNARKLMGTAPVIGTAVDDVKFTSGLERMASIMNRGTILRTIHGTDQLAQHPDEQFQIMTGYEFPSAFRPPSLGAKISRTLGPRHPTVPPNIHLGRQTKDGFAQTSNNREFLNELHGAGFYGIDHEPFVVVNPGDGIATLRAAAGISGERLDRRLELLHAMAANAPPPFHENPESQMYLKVLKSAREMMDSPAREAFDISGESGATRSHYNTQHSFGQGCLVARRLVERGARYVQVDYPYQPFNLIDGHSNGAKLNAEVRSNIDGPVSQLVLDLEERGLLDRTLVVILSEFGRTISAKDGVALAKKDSKLEIPKHYGFHSHFGKTNCALFYGGGFKRGFAYGKTASEHPMVAVENQVSVSDLHATILTAMGISPDVYYLTQERPVYVTKDGLGKPIKALYS